MSRLAIDIGGTHLRYELVGEGRETCGILPSKKTEISLFIESMLKSHPGIDAVAVSFAGQVHDGVILSAPNIEVRRPDLRDYFETAYGIPLRIENDLNCAALAESVYWKEGHLVALYSGTGLGSGIVERGEICHGFRSLAGEIGHVPYRKAPFACGCGKDNCLELYASGAGIGKWMRHFGCDGSPDLKRFYHAKDDSCRQVAIHYIEALLHASATLVTLLNPKILVLGGGVVSHNPFLLPIVRKKITEFALLTSCDGLNIEMTRIENASLEGAKLLLDTM
ncbi:ROK family protein [Hydrogenimonas urashimensis]|uniref:ROK family protein n=1 Tax=Hydrogenimonas urashimensis TaxID=2740515 RepID=UPI0019157B40|nr:ROK family protein [Hydrogenimonas urashimensis]